MIAFALQLLYLVFIYKFHFSFKKATILSLILLLITYTLPFIEQKGIYEKRSEVWQTAAVAGFQQPVIGHGFGNIEFALKKTAKELKTNLTTSYVDSGHNIFLDWWVQGGVFGLSILLTLLFQAFKTNVRRKQTLQNVLLFGLLAVLSFNPASVVTLVALWWVIGYSSFK